MTVSWALLCWPSGIITDTVLSTYFDMLKVLRTEKSLSRGGLKKPRAKLGPWGRSRWYFTLLRQTALDDFDSLERVWKEDDNPIDDTVRNVNLFQFVTKILWSIRSKALRPRKETSHMAVHFSGLIIEPLDTDWSKPWISSKEIRLKTLGSWEISYLELILCTTRAWTKTQ